MAVCGSIFGYGWSSNSSQRSHLQSSADMLFEKNVYNKVITETTGMHNVNRENNKLVSGKFCS